MKRNSILENRRIQVSLEVRHAVDLSFQIVDRIHEILESQGLKQKHLAERLGKSEAEISKWMRGTHNFTFSTLSAIEHALDAPVISVISSKYTLPEDTMHAMVAEGIEVTNGGSGDKCRYLLFGLSFKSCLSPFKLPRPCVFMVA